METLQLLIRLAHCAMKCSGGENRERKPERALESMESAALSPQGTCSNGGVRKCKSQVPSQTRSCCWLLPASKVQSSHATTRCSACPPTPCTESLDCNQLGLPDAAGRRRCPALDWNVLNC